MMCRINNQTLDISGGVRVDKDDLDTGADDQDASEESDDTMPLRHTMATQMLAGTARFK